MSNEKNGLTRRGFVQATAAGVAGTWAAAAVARSANVAGSDGLKIGLIGCGGRGTGAAGQALTADKGAVLTAMGDVLPDRLESSHKALSGEYGDRVRVTPETTFVGFDAYQRVIDSGVDVVLLATTPNFRPMHLKAAVAAGKHVFCEKPMAVDAPGLRSVMESAAEARAKGLSLVSGFCWRYSDAERATFGRVLDGAIGDVVSVHTTYHTGTLGARPRKPEWSDVEFQLRNWWHFAWLSGDHIVEQAVHSIDKLAWVMGGRLPLRATCLGGRQARSGPESGHAYDHFFVCYEYENGVRSFHSCRQIDGCPSDNSDYITGTRGTAVVNGWTPTHRIRTAFGEWNYDGPRRNMYQVEHDELFASIRSGRPLNDGEWMCNSTMMAIMGRMAAYTGQTITWDQAMNSQEDLSPPVYGWTDLPVPPVAIPGKTKFF